MCCKGVLLLNDLLTAQAGQSFVIDAIDLSLPAQKYFDLNNCFVRTIPSWFHVQASKLVFEEKLEQQCDLCVIKYLLNRKLFTEGFK